MGGGDLSSRIVLPFQKLTGHGPALAHHKLLSIMQGLLYDHHLNKQNTTHKATSPTKFFFFFENKKIREEGTREKGKATSRTLCHAVASSWQGWTSSRNGSITCHWSTVGF